MTDASYSLAFFLKVLERILALKHPRALVLDILEEITNLDSKNGYSLEPIMLETMIQIALWLPRVNINFLSSYKLPSVYDILKFAGKFGILLFHPDKSVSTVRIEVVQRRVEQTSQRIGLALLDTSVITASALKSQPFQQCIATNPRHIHVFSVIVWDRTNEVVGTWIPRVQHSLDVDCCMSSVFCLNRNLHANFVKTQYSLVLFQLPSWNVISEPVLLRQAKEVE